MRVLTIDLGGSHATVAVVEDRRILASHALSVDSTAGLLPMLPVFQRIAFALLDQINMAVADCDGFVISFCGMVDTRTSRVVSTNGKYEDAPGIDLPTWCMAEFGLPLAMDNDARVALLGEWYAGAAQGAMDVVMITLGTGIGGAVLAGGKPYRTNQVQGGCIGGHIPVLFTGRKCSCGGYGCMEAEASQWTLPTIAREWPGYASSRLAELDTVNFRSLFELAREDDRVSKEIRDRCLQIWACGTVGLIHAYGPERVIFGGGVMKSGDVILPFIRSYVERNSWTPSGSVSILPAALGNDAALLGAIPLMNGVQ
jgi:glucokinase